MADKKFTVLEKALGYRFQEPQLLLQALTHCSASRYNNERLEFLGDSVLNFIIASMLFKKFPTASEGNLTRMRARLVREETLAQIAHFFSLGQFIQLGMGEQKSGGATRVSILADTVEAIIGAIYLDTNMQVCQEIVLSWYRQHITELSSSNTPEKDAKSKLQEYLQAKGLPLPDYKVSAVHGAPHEQEFRIECIVSLFDEPAIGIAKSRRKAEQIAAEKILERLKHVKHK